VSYVHVPLVVHCCLLTHVGGHAFSPSGMPMHICRRASCRTLGSARQHWK
jgi:hypothetical protein